MKLRTAFGLAAIALLAAACGSAPDEGPVASSNQDLVVCAGGAIVQGIDVSYYQGSINWTAVHNSGRGFGIARIADGTGFMDPTFQTNYAGMKSVGMVRGSYIFFRPETDPIAQADEVLKAIGTLGDGDLPPMLDVEVTDGVAASTIVSRINQWISHVTAAIGRRPMVYTAPYFWSQLGSPSVAADLVVANWGPSCPTVPGGWSGWSAWQYADNGSVSGISGAVDLDEFNGSLADLQKYARPPDTPPRGYLDVADCDSVRGWAQDPDAPNDPIHVDLYFNGTAGAPGAAGLRTLANVHRDDLCTAIGSCDHGFVVPIPLGMQDGASHEVHAYGIDTAGGNNPELPSTKTFQCPNAAPPLAPDAGVLRHVTSPAAMTAWGFSSLLDVAPEPDSVVSSYGQSADWQDAPELVQADDGTPEVWLLDGEVRRHVISPDSLAAWHRSFSEVKKLPADQVYAYAKGLDLPATPFLVKGTGPAIYVLDVAPPGPPPDPTNPTGHHGGGTPAGNGDSGGGGGCSMQPSAPAHASAAFALLPLFVLARRRRRG
jgi:GH25 family lysozyme M1 (1,4-beta-N-acetylmuramidase)